ncbi:MAG: single-stranded DNA-binding protein [Clostridia bacterium]|nr:single-stranded DNA-binding protein [Clostridia bacterium]
MNKAILMGRLTQDPEMRQTPNGISVARFTVAVNRRFAKEGGQTADFINCIAWRQTADFVCRFFHKGNMIALVGSIQTRNWDGNDGKKHYATEVVAEEVYFTGEKAAASSGSGYGQNTRPATGQIVQPDFDDFDTMGFSTIDGSEDDLPF